jgi:hypothetical protein
MKKVIREYTVESYVLDGRIVTRKKRKTKFNKLPDARAFAKQLSGLGAFISLKTKGGTPIPYTK